MGRQAASGKYHAQMICRSRAVGQQSDDGGRAAGAPKPLPLSKQRLKPPTGMRTSARILRASSPPSKLRRRLVTPRKLLTKAIFRKDEFRAGHRAGFQEAGCQRWSNSTANFSKRSIEALRETSRQHGNWLETG